MAEEVSEAAITVPRAMIWSFLLNVPFTFGLLLTYLFCIGSVEDAVLSPTGFPFTYVFQNATKSVLSTIGMTVVILILLIMITISAMASTARQTFAFARDNGLPFSHVAEQSRLEDPHSGEQHHLHLSVHNRDFIDQYRVNRCVQRHALAVHSGADGNVPCLNWLRYLETPPKGAAASVEMDFGARRVAGQCGSFGLRRVGFLLVVLAERT